MLVILLKRYGFSGIIRLTFYLLLTKIKFPKARLIRLPIDIRNRKLIELGEGLTTGKNCRIEAYNLDNSSTPKIIFGRNIQLNDNVHIVGSNLVTLGDNVLIAGNVFISDTSHGNYDNQFSSLPEEIPISRRKVTNPVIIGKNVWIGENVVILPGVQIGDGSIIGAGSIVTKNIDNNCIVAGNPARVIKKFNSTTNLWEKTY